MVSTLPKERLLEVTSMFAFGIYRRRTADPRLSNVVWAADTNYRVDLENDVVRALATADNLDHLYAADQVSTSVSIAFWGGHAEPFQLRSAMDNQAVFVGYQEGPILFRPTYRYDVGSNEYDTSEKMRIPAWTGECSQILAIAPSL